MKRSSSSIFYLLFIFISCQEASCTKEEDAKEDLPIKKTYTEELPEGYTLIESDVQNFFLDTILTGLDRPWGMDFLPNGDLLYTERQGSMHIVNVESKKSTEILGLPLLVASGQGGLLDVRLHPKFQENSLIYFSYSKKINLNYTTEVSRARLSGNQLTEVESIFTAKPGFTTNHHFGCRLALTDDYIFISVGDRGQMEMAQNLEKHNGKIIRLHLDGSIPSDNPFVSVNDAQPEIWSYGHRNPQGLAIHPETGTLWEHEHGPKGGDEINTIDKGLNYGWPEITYGIDYDGSIISPFTHKEGMEQPVTYWDPSIAPCGMTFVPDGGSASKYPDWKGNLFLGGLASRALFRIVLNEHSYVSEERLLDGIGRVRNVATSPEDFLYISVEDPGMILRLAPVNE